MIVGANNDGSRSWTWLYAAICFGAVAVRLLYLWRFEGSPLTVSSDAGAYHDIAVNLLTRHQFVTAFDPPHRLDLPYAVRPPLTPMFLAGLYWLFGPSMRVAQIAFSVVGGLSAVALVRLTRMVSTPGVAITAGVLASGYPFFVFLSAMPLTENLGVFLSIVLVSAFVQLRNVPMNTNAVVAGALLGFAALNKPTAVGFLPIAIAWLIWEFRARLIHAVVLAGIVTLSFLAVLTPWTVRNYAQLGALVPVTTQAGWTLYMGNGFHTEYSLARLEHGASGWYDQPGYGAALGDRTGADGDREARRQAIAFIERHPAKFVEFAARKVRVFWSAYPNLIHRISWWMLVCLALAGAVLAGPAHRILVPAYLLMIETAIVPVFFTSMPRFRAPIEPFLLLLAAVPLTAAIGRLRPAPRATASA